MRLRADVPRRFATPSLGLHRAHTLDAKFAALARAGFDHVELGFGNYVAWVRARQSGLPASTCPAAWKVDDEPDPSDLVLCEKLGVRNLQVGSNDQAGADAGPAKVAADMRWLAEHARPHAVGIALGLYLDTAQIALSPSYGFDPASSSADLAPALPALLARLRAVAADKIFFFLGVSDVLRPDPAVGHGSRFNAYFDANKSPGTSLRSLYVLCARPGPYVGARAGRNEAQDDARVAELAQAVLDTGFRGPSIWEMFEALEMEQDDPGVPGRYANLGKTSRDILFSKLSATHRELEQETKTGMHGCPRRLRFRTTLLHYFAITHFTTQPTGHEN
ncbi:hypothetical protein Q5752_004661 [Cryptotrichosporon argae]